METIHVKLTGISPLLMHSFPLLPIEAIEKKSPEEQAELAAYRQPTGTDGTKGDLYIPGVAVQRALVAGGAYVKGKGRASLQKAVAACVLVTPEYISLGTPDYVIDARPVVIPATKGRVVRYRPRLDKWSCSFEIEYDETLMTEVELRKIADYTCSRVGFLDFRPERKGPFGRAIVTLWDRD